jgi:hypothetical protein
MSGIVAQNILDSSGLVKAPEGGGAWNFIAKQTASADATISFTSGIDSTYKEYVFTYNNIHPATDDVEFQFNVSIDGGSNYNVAKTTTYFRTYNYEDGSDAALGYRTPRDLAQGTGFQALTEGQGNGNDESCSGQLTIFNPSDTTFAKHFIARNSMYGRTDYEMDIYVAGYANTTSAVDAVQFKMSSGNIDAGDICLYGVSS